MSGRQRSSNPANVLRSAISGPFPTLRREALRVVRYAIWTEGSFSKAAEKLGLHWRTFQKLRADFPEEFRKDENDDPRTTTTTSVTEDGEGSDQS